MLNFYIFMKLRTEIVSLIKYLPISFKLGQEKFDNWVLGATHITPNQLNINRLGVFILPSVKQSVKTKRKSNEYVNIIT